MSGRTTTGRAMGATGTTRRSDARKSPVVVMIGTHPRGEGGIAAVIRGYFEAGLGDQWPVVLLASHGDTGGARKLARWLVSWMRLAWMVALRRCAVIHLHTASRASFWRKWTFYLLARLGSVPVIWHLHGGQFQQFYEDECGPWRRRLIRRAFAGAFRVVVLSEHWRGLLHAMVPRANIVVMPNCVPVGAPAADGPREPCFVYMGRITQGKGVYDLLEAIRLVAATQPEARLVIAGTGESARVLARARELGIDGRVELAGWVEGAGKQALLARARALVLPSYAEGLPMVILEAMALSTPVIATPVGGVPDLIQDGHNGLLVAPGDSAGLAAAMCRLLTERGLAADMGAAGRRLVQGEFGMQGALSRLGLLYRLAGASSRRVDMGREGHQPYTPL